MNEAFVLNLSVHSVCPLLRVQEFFEEMFQFQPRWAYYPGTDVAAPMVEFKPSEAPGVALTAYETTDALNISSEIRSVGIFSTLA